jgi:hypothetical protein
MDSCEVLGSQSESEPEPEAVAVAPEPEPVAVTNLAPAPVCGEIESGVSSVADLDSGGIEMEVVGFPRNLTMVLCRPVGSGKGSPMRLVYVGWAASFKLGAKLRVIPGGLGFSDVWQLVGERSSDAKGKIC